MVHDVDPENKVETMFRCGEDEAAGKVNLVLSPVHGNESEVDSVRHPSGGACRHAIDVPIGKLEIERLRLHLINHS